MSNSQLVIAIAKGYLLEEGISLLTSYGYVFEDDFKTTRKLYIEDSTRAVRVLIVRPWDVPVYVAEGAAHLGIVGYDVLCEHQVNLLSLLDLKFGHCKLVLAGLNSKKWELLTHNLTIATKYPRSTAAYFREKGLNVKLVKLYGAMSYQLPLSFGLKDLTS